VAGDDLHENLIAEFPRAVAARCDGQGWVNIDYPADGPLPPWQNATRCPRCARQRDRNLIAAFIPPRFRERISVPDAVTEWAKLGSTAQGLYLAGPVGSGKTHAAWVAVSKWCAVAGVVPAGAGRSEDDYYGGSRFGPTVVFARMVDLLDDFRPGNASVQRVRDCQNAKLLVIDDLGAERPSEWTQERLYSVVDHRYANCLPLLVTGNVPPAKLAEQTGDRVASRLAEMCRVVPMTGADRRRAA
jgi:DNA replication protein DnaC